MAKITLGPTLTTLSMLYIQTINEQTIRDLKKAVTPTNKKQTASFRKLKFNFCFVCLNILFFDSRELSVNPFSKLPSGVFRGLKFLQRM